MAACEASTVRRGKSYDVLEVISTNGPARRLYEVLGYRFLRKVAWYYRDLGPGEPPLPTLPAGTAAASIRSFENRDGETLSRLAQARQPPDDRAVRPVGPRSFRSPPLLMAVLGSESAAFVVDRAGSAAGFVRVSESGGFPSGHVVAPVVAPDLPEEVAGALLDRGLAWFRERPVRRVVCEIPLDDAAGVARLEARGFRVGLTVEALAKRVAP
jgi:ribosomal protein S18 acetylase RimI-like enzyme